MFAVYNSFLIIRSVGCHPLDRLSICFIIIFTIVIVIAIMNDRIDSPQKPSSKRISWIRYLWQHVTINNLAWLLTWIFCSVGCFYQSVEVIRSYMKSETSTSIEYLQMQHLPGVTFCFLKHAVQLDRSNTSLNMHKLNIAEQINHTFAFSQLVTRCELATVNGSQPCDKLLSITEYVTLDQKCIALHEPDPSLYHTRIRPMLAFNRTVLYKIHLNRSLLRDRFDLTIHNLTNPLQVFDQNWIKLDPLRYSAAKIGFKHVQLSLLPLPYDTNCSEYGKHRTKANCLNECFKEKYHFTEELWPPFVPGYNTVKKVFTDNVYIEDANVTTDAPKRTVRSSADPDGLMNGESSAQSTTTRLMQHGLVSLSTPVLDVPTTISMTDVLTTSQPNTTTSTTPSSRFRGISKERLKLLQNIIRKANQTKPNQGFGYKFITERLIIQRSRFNFREETESNRNRISQSKYSLKGIADIRGHCDHRCDIGRQCHQDIYTPVRGLQLDAGPQSLLYRVEIEPAKFLIRCLSTPRYLGVHLICFIASTVTLWFGGSIYRICIFCCLSPKRRMKVA